jgi:tol-pal system protein YbgF
MSDILSRGAASMKNSSVLPLLSLLLALTGCATQGALDTTRNDINAVKTRLFSVEKDLEGIRGESKERLDALEKEVKSEIGSVRKIAADVQASGETTRSEMQALNGKLDDMPKPGDELTRYREDTDKRILALEERIVKLQATIDELDKKGGDSAQPKQPKDTQPPADAIYLKGLEAFKAGDMPAARDFFTKFIEQYPKHELVGNARYWSAETLYAEKKYEAAIVAFQDVIKIHPKLPKIPAALLKQARAFKAINDINSSRYVLKKLISAYPKSDEAKKARELLKEIK